MKRTLDDDERAAFVELLRATKRARSLLLELLNVDERKRRDECVHAFERRWCDGPRDNGEGYDLVCTRCGHRA